MSNNNQIRKYEDCLVYVGTYTDGSSEGIFICRLDTLSGELQQVGVVRDIENPSFLSIDAERNKLFTVNELSEFNGLPGGGLSAFTIDPSSGDLTLINQQPSNGGAPCYLSIDSTGRHLLVANYMGSNIAVLPVSQDGSLEKAVDIVAHSGSSLIPERQEGSHPHSIVLDPTAAYAFVPDLGLDKVMQYRFDNKRGKLYPNRQPWIEVEPGSGPRHLVFHPNGKHAYVINELRSSITAYVYDSDLGVLELYQTISTIPEGFAQPNLAADLHLSPDGKLLIGSNRGHDSLACYCVDLETGRLKLIGFIETQGRTPRGFAFDPTGTFVLVANQDSHTIVTFGVDTDQGKLFPTGQMAHIPSPVCISFFC